MKQPCVVCGQGPKAHGSSIMHGYAPSKVVVAPKLCTSCKRGDIEGVAASGPNGEQRQVTVLDPETGRIELRGYLCEEHFTMYADDGYKIVEDRR